MANEAVTQVVGSGDNAKDTLSQFVARVLNQLSLSAWLPSAALVLMLDYVVELGNALDASSNRPDGPSPPVAAFRALADISLGGAFLLVVGVIVLTLATQAFAFEAIRVLEGYWGTYAAVEWLARLRCNRHRRTRRRLDQRRADLTEIAWDGAHKTILSINDDLQIRGQPAAATAEAIEFVRRRVLGKLADPNVRFEDDDDVWDLESNWRDLAPPDALRRRTNVEKRLRDYPADVRMLPTRLGNVLRHYEDEAGRGNVETLVQRVFDSLPLSLKIEHDEQRTRLDLYCSMVFVVAMVTSISAIRLGLRYPGYAAITTACGFAGVWLMYRAGIASARAYGGLLVLVADHTQERDDAPDPPNRPAGK